MSVTRIDNLLIVITVLVFRCNVSLLISKSIGLPVLSLHPRLLILFQFKLRLDISKLLFLLKLKHFRINVLDGGLDIGYTGSSHRYGPGGEDLQCGFWVPDFIRDPGVQLGLVGGLLERLGEGDNLDGKGEGAGAEDVDYAPVLDADVLVLVIQLLEDPGELPGADPGLLLAVGAGAGDLAAAPDGGRGVGMPQLHRDHPIFSTILHIGTIKSYFF